MTRGIPLPPAERPVKYREAARIVVVAGQSVLLLADTDPGVPNLSWWVTPGGGLDEGEDWLDAATRELLEETGQLITPDQLSGPIASRVVRHGYCDRVLVQREMFYRLDVAEQFEPSTAGLTQEEQQTLQGSGWFSVEEMSRMQVWPAGLAPLMSRQLSAEPGEEQLVDWGVMDESSVPVLPGQADDLPADWLTGH